MILASFTPFTVAGPYKEYGPVFILADPTGEAVRRDVLPVRGADRYLRESFVIRAYSPAEEIVDAIMGAPETAPAIVARFFGDPSVAFLHVRFPTYGCFAMRINRGD